MGSATMAMAVFLLAFNISACIYVRGLIKSFHRDQNCLPKWAKVTREAIEKLDGAKKQFFLDEIFDDTVESPLEKSFFSSSLFDREDMLRLKVTEKGFDMRDEMELRNQARKSKSQTKPQEKANMDSLREEDVHEIVEMALEDKKIDAADDMYTSVSTLKQRFEEYIESVQKKKQESEDYSLPLVNSIMIASDLRTLFVRPSSASPKFVSADLNEIRKTLESGSESARISTMKSLIVSLVNGERELVESLLMTLIRFILPLRNKTLKKLLLYLFENIPKTDSEGNLKQEFILVCNAWRNDLQHPNEFIRGATLRFLGHLREAELLEPLVPSVRQCLEHEHVYVRRNAIYAALSIFKQVEYLIPDAPELVEGLLTHERDLSCQRAAFYMLSQTEPERALNYFNLIADRLAELDGSLQLAVIAFIRQDVRNDADNGNRLLKILLSLMKKSSSSAARFEAATTLMTLHIDEEILRGCCDVLIQLAIKEADNSIKLVVLLKLRDSILPRHPTIIQACVLDLLRILAAPDATIRSVCLELVAAGTSSRVASEIVQFLKKELAKSEGDSAYRRELLDALHICSIKFSEVATEVMTCYLDLLKSGYASETLITFIKEALFKYPRLRSDYLTAVIDALPSVNDSKAVRNLLWVLGEFCHEEENSLKAIDSIISCFGELPMMAAEERYEASLQKENKEEEEAITVTVKPSSRPKVLADGTYATESAFLTQEASLNAASNGRQSPNIKKLFLDGKFECSGVLANALTKLLIRLRAAQSSHFEAVRGRCLLALTSILRLGSSRFVAASLDSDSAERIALCIQLALQSDASLEHAFTENSEAACNAALLQDSSSKTTFVKSHASIDDLVDFGFDRKVSVEVEYKEDDGLNSILSSSSNSNNNTKVTTIGKSSATLLNKIVQLTGFSDTIYAETYVQVRDKEIYLDILLVNQTEEVLQNLSVDLNCAGDLKLIERPGQLTLSPLAFATCKAVLKVTATNHGQIFGSISFLAGNEADCVVLAEHRIDVLEYISPASIPEARFREAWVLLEWENKITIRVRPEQKLLKATGSSENPLLAFVNFVTEAGRMNCITPNAGLQGTSTFLACNFYAKSIFDEEILANVCLEYVEGMITGHLRLRSKTQGLAIAFGDKLNSLLTK